VKVAFCLHVVILGRNPNGDHESALVDGIGCWVAEVFSMHWVRPLETKKETTLSSYRHCRLLRCMKRHEDGGFAKSKADKEDRNLLTT